MAIGDSSKGSFLRRPLALSGVGVVVTSNVLPHRPVEVEGALPGLAHAIIWNDPAPAGEEGGEDEVMVCVVPTAEIASLDPAALIACCEPRMPSYAVSRSVVFLTALPKTPSEKIKKGVLRERGVTPATWDRMATAGRGMAVDARGAA